MTTLDETDYFTIRHIPHKTLGTHLLVGVHFPSKSYANDSDYNAMAQLLKQSIEKAERTTKDCKTVVVGDFNMNPFEEAMVAAYAMHSVSDRNMALKGSRIVRSQSYTMFYNPMWNLLGDAAKPSGTYFYPRSGQLTYFWNVFDQVIIRPLLMDNFIIDSLKIIETIGTFPLVDKNKRPDKSITDHLPIFFEIK